MNLLPFVIPKEEIIDGLREAGIVCVHCDKQSNIVTEPVDGEYRGYCYYHWEYSEVHHSKTVAEIKGDLVAEIRNGEIHVYEKAVDRE